MFIVCKNECPPVITIFHFSPRGFFPAGIFGEKIPAVIFKKNKLRFTLAICMTHLSMFQVYINILIFPIGKNPRGDISPQEFFLAGILPHGDFFLHSIHP